MPPNQDIFSPVSTWLLPAFALAILLCRQSAFSPQAHDDAQESIRPHCALLHHADDRAGDRHYGGVEPLVSECRQDTPVGPIDSCDCDFCAKLVVDKIRHSKHEARRRVAHASVTLAQTSAPGRTQAVAQLANVMNGAAVALASTMTSYWFSVRFDAPEALIGLVVSASYIATGMVALAAVRLADRFGPVHVMLYMQLCGILFVLALPWARWFWLAAVLNMGCMALNLGSRGSRSAIAAAGTRGQRSWQRKVSTMIVLSLTTGAWPSAFGRMLEEGEYVLPFCVAASAQLFSTMWFRAVYRRTPNS